MLQRDSVYGRATLVTQTHHHIQWGALPVAHTAHEAILVAYFLFRGVTDGGGEASGWIQVSWA